MLLNEYSKLFVYNVRNPQDLTCVFGKAVILDSGSYQLTLPNLKKLERPNEISEPTLTLLLARNTTSAKLSQQRVIDDT